MTTLSLLILIIFALELGNVCAVRFLLAPRFLLALWRVHVVFPLKRRKPCCFAGCNRQRCEYDGRIERWCDFHHREIHERYDQPLGSLR
jgi:hypothetical protein